MAENVTAEERALELALRTSKILSACSLRGWDGADPFEDKDRGPQENHVRELLMSSIERIHSGNVYDLLSVDRDLDIAESLVFKGFPEDKLEQAILLVMS